MNIDLKPCPFCGEKTCQFALKVCMIGNMLCVATLAMREVEENRTREKQSKSGTGGMNNERRKL